MAQRYTAGGLKKIDVQQVRLSYPVTYLKTSTPLLPIASPHKPSPLPSQPSTL